MADGYTELIDRANEFFAALARNNTRDWFEPRKAAYVAEIRKPAERLGDRLAGDIARLTGKPHRPKLFRIYRDVRFSRDKTPFNPHLHLMWTQAAPDAPAWFFGAAPDYLVLGVGLMGPKGAALTRYRALVDSRGTALSDAIAAAAAGVGARISNWGPAPLKRVPKPFDPDHPQGDLLRRKALALDADLPADWRAAGLTASVDRVAAALLPVWRILDQGMG